MSLPAADDLRATARKKRKIEIGFLVAAFILTAGLYLSVQAAGQATIPTSFWWVIGFTALLIICAHMAIRALAPNATPYLLPCVVLLTGIGFSMIARIDPGLASYQSLWIAVGIVAFVATLYLLRDYRTLDEWRYTAMIIALILLLLPLAPIIGKEVNGARLWIQVGPLNFQPVEIAKILLVIFFASYLAENRELLAIPTRHFGRMGIPDVKHFGPLIVVFAFSILILIFENDLGQSVLIFSTFLLMLYLATSRAVYSLVGLGLFALGTWIAFLLFDRVAVRFQGWLAPFNPETIKVETFQISQSLFAIASGGLFGTNPGLGRPEQIPEASSDFIFAIITQETGLVGATGVMLLFVLFVTIGVRTALRCEDSFGKLLGAGLASLVGIQAFIIIAGVTRLIPLTGITLPFVSYGGSSIFSNFIILGILIAISDQVTAGPRGSGWRSRKPVEVGEKLPVGAV